jgi:hypothetical protein
MKGISISKYNNSVVDKTNLGLTRPITCVLLVVKSIRLIQWSCQSTCELNIKRVIRPKLFTNHIHEKIFW